MAPRSRVGRCFIKECRRWQQRSRRHRRLRRLLQLQRWRRRVRRLCQEIRCRSRCERCGASRCARRRLEQRYAGRVRLRHDGRGVRDRPVCWAGACLPLCAVADGLFAAAGDGRLHRRDPFARPRPRRRRLRRAAGRAADGSSRSRLLLGAGERTDRERRSRDEPARVESTAHHSTA